MKVLITTAPLHGHFFPLVPLGWALRAAGHEVLVATSDHFLPTATRAGLAAVPTGPGIRVEELGDPTSAHGIRDARYAHGLVFARMAARNLRGTIAAVDGWRPDLVICERAELAGPVAAALGSVPFVELHWGVAHLPEYQEAATATLVPLLRRYGLTEVPAPATTYNPWPPTLRLDYAAGHGRLRHVPYNGHEKVLPWMLRRPQRPRVCLTLGTVLPHVGRDSVDRTIRGITVALAEQGCEIVVAVDDEVAGRLRGLPDLVVHAGRTPLSETLSTCDLLVHHGGQGTALTALASGRPQVVLPRFDDQIENAQAVERAGAGLVLAADEADGPVLADRVAQVLAEERFRSAAARTAAEIRAQPSPGQVAALLTGAFLADTARPVPVA